jgi:hypothetical protein
MKLRHSLQQELVARAQGVRAGGDGAVQVDERVVLSYFGHGGRPGRWGRRSWRSWSSSSSSARSACDPRDARLRRDGCRACRRHTRCRRSGRRMCRGGICWAGQPARSDSDRPASRRSCGALRSTSRCEGDEIVAAVVDGRTQGLRVGFGGIELEELAARSLRDRSIMPLNCSAVMGRMA